MSGPDPAYYPNLGARLLTLDAAVGSVPRRDVEGPFVRNMPADVLAGHGSPPVVDLLWVEGYKSNHTRYGRLGAFPLYHISDGVVTAAQEVFGGPRTAVATNAVPSKSRLDLRVETELHGVMDLVEATVRASLGITETEITEIPDWLTLDTWGRPDAYELTQYIGELAHAAGFGAIRYPAARYDKGTNIAIFADRLETTRSWIEIINPLTGARQRLPAPAP